MPTVKAQSKRRKCYSISYAQKTNFLSLDSVRFPKENHPKYGCSKSLNTVTCLCPGYFIDACSLVQRLECRSDYFIDVCSLVWRLERRF